MNLGFPMSYLALHATKGNHAPTGPGNSKFWPYKIADQQGAENTCLARGSRSRQGHIRGTGERLTTYTNKNWQVLKTL